MRFDKIIGAAAEKHGVPPALIKAVIWKESRFNPDARGTKGEFGLMQIMELTGLEWAGAHRMPLGEGMLLRPDLNVDCGTWYLRKLLARYRHTDNPIPYALADYNAGRSNALKWMQGSARTNSAAFIEQIGFPSTQRYVRDVMGRLRKYEDQFRTKQSAPASSYFFKSPKMRFASSSVSFEPMSNQMPGTRHV
jgi:soluble lytic murein transglycosylase